MNKVTMQDIADALGISRVTVWKVFNNYTNVSASVREKVLLKAKELGYTKGLAEVDDGVLEKNVSLIVSRPNSSTFWTTIIHRAAQELSRHNVNLMYTYVPSNYSEDFRMPSVLSNGTVQGAIVLNVYDKRMIGQISQLSIPKVFLDTVPEIQFGELQGDLVLLEGFHSTYQITKSVVERGLKKIGFVGDIQYARTNYDRFEGFCRCMEDHGLLVEKELCLTGRIGIFSYNREINGFLDSLERLPDAFICASDFIAHTMQLYFAEHRERIPEGIVVTGYDGRDEYAVGKLITTAEVQTGVLGKRLAMQIVYRMEHGDAPYELTYVNPPVIYRDSVLRG